MSPVSGPLIQVTRSFDPRELAGLELWLWHATLPNKATGVSLATSDIWPGAPPLGDFPGSAADAIWSADPTNKAYILNENSADLTTLIADPWIAGARALVFDNAIHLNFVETGTSTPYTVTLAGELTILLVLRNPETTTFVLMDDGQATPEGGIGITSDRVQAVTSTRTPGSFTDVSPDDIEGLNDSTAVVLLLLTRDASNDWRCWVNGVQQEGTSSEDGSIVLKNLGQFSADAGFPIQVADVLIYGADWTSRAADLNAYFANQHGIA